MALFRRPASVVVLLMALALLYWVWFGLTQRSIFQDEGISILAAQGIAEQGQPRLPSGYIYTRGYLPHYLVGGSIFAFGLNQLSIMLPSLILGLGSLFMVYAFARDILRKPWAGVLAIALLLVLSVQTLYATSPRMYIALQFFTLLGAYSAWRGYVEGVGKFKPIAVVAIIAAMLSHTQAFALAVAVPFGIIAAEWWKNRTIAPLLSLQNVAAWAVLIAAGVFIRLYVPADAVPLITAYNFASDGVFGLRLNPVEWFDGDLGLRGLALYGVGFVPLALFVAVAAIRRRWLDADRALIYMLIIVTVGAAVTFVGTAEPYIRMWFFVLPFYALMLAQVAAQLAGRYGPELAEWFRRKPASRITAASVLVIAVFAVLGVGSFALEPGYGGFVSDIIGLPCRDAECSKRIEEHYAHLRTQIRPDDVIVSSNPFVTAFYLGRVDGYLKAKVIVRPNGTEEWFDYLEDEYFGIPLFDASDLRGHLSSESRVLVIADQRIEWITGEETKSMLGTSYAEFRGDEVITTYANCDAAPCRAR
ncbi:MAG: hypothetical protein L0177_00815 [Chloroflexi bacterium]|nr:hypothetical protein [Chloroflexota bacterium]